MACGMFSASRAAVACATNSRKVAALASEAEITAMAHTTTRAANNFMWMRSTRTITPLMRLREHVLQLPEPDALWIPLQVSIQKRDPVSLAALPFIKEREIDPRCLKRRVEVDSMEEHFFRARIVAAVLKSDG